MKRAEAWIQEPKQLRSQRTLDAVLDAAESLLEKRSFHEIPVGDIVEAAGSSAGSFYARFRDKRALLHALHERVSARIGELAGPFAAIPPAAVQAEAVRQVVSVIAETHRRNRGVLRAAMVESIQDPLFAARALANAQKILAAIYKALEPYRGSVPSGEYLASVAFGLRVVLAVLDQQLFLPEPPRRSGRGDDADLIRRLTVTFADGLKTEGRD